MKEDTPAPISPGDVFNLERDECIRSKKRSPSPLGDRTAMSHERLKRREKSSDTKKGEGRKVGQRALTLI